MPVPRRFLRVSGHPAAAPPPEPMELDSEVVVILSALLCALICFIGLALVARCAWLRRYSWGPPLPLTEPPTPPPTDRGLSRNALRSIPKLSFHPGAAPTDCPICLAEFADGDEVRVLPQCGHQFHVACVDLWLGSHSSCPSCRRILVAGAGGARRCHKCGAMSDGSSASPVPASTDLAEAAQVASAPQEDMERMAKAREDADTYSYRFLPL